MGIAYAAGMVLFVMVAALLTLLVLLQKSRGGGLVFGAAGRESVLGANAPAALFWFTTALFGLFLGLAVVLNLTA